LKESGQQENTLVVFTSDNGGQLSVGANNGRLRGGKQEMYEGGLRVPMCAVWPGRIESGSRSRRVSLTMDLFPTLCESAGVKNVPGSLDGRTILPTLLGEAQAEDGPALFWARREGNNLYMGKTIWAVRRGPWKLLQNSPTRPFELYNLADDPQEERDLAKTNRREYDELARLLRAHIQRGGAVPWQKLR
jgi:arylsulfatase A-like enzyme